MSAPRPLEQALLAPVEGLLSVTCYEERLEVLEGAASALGSFNLAQYRALTQAQYLLPQDEAAARGAMLLEALREVPIHPALALSALARPPLSPAEQRRSGAYYTDFRLASYLAAQVPKSVRGPVVDPACGSGILLVALTLQLCGNNRKQRAAFLRDKVCGADLSDEALRGASLALAALTDNMGAIRGLRSRLRRVDSLVAGPAGWADVAPDGFAACIGNPPWEKLKLSRHEHLRFNGTERHYGDDYEPDAEVPSPELVRARERMAEYVKQVSRTLALQGRGEADLYKLFLELCISLVKGGGHLALLVPAGLIRSQGTAALREHLLAEMPALRITVLHNRARFFAIDTRFKFLTVVGQVRFSGGSTPVALAHAEGTDSGVAVTSTARIGRKTLRSVRPDVSLPEVRSRAEWSLFRRAHERGVRLGDPDGQWLPHILREVDMTRERPLFHRDPTPDTAALVEGRMVHQYRVGAKRYVQGTGRSAVWKAVPPGDRLIASQFHMPTSELPDSVARRISRPRVGFCDITGQTNERSMLSALIPAGVICGNKVPTIVFGGADCDAERAEDLSYLWLAISNSIPFDWLLRRVITTTVNFFVLRDLPVPALDVANLPARRLIQTARDLTAVDEGRKEMDLWDVGLLRAKIDAAVAAAYGFGVDDLELMLADFPLLDRGQPTLPECGTTVTRDAALAVMDDHLRASDRGAAERGRLARWREAGALPYVPVEYADVFRSALKREAPVTHAGAVP